MFGTHGLRHPPPAVDILTCRGRRSLSLSEMVVNRRSWQDYIDYLGTMLNKPMNVIERCKLDQMIKEAMLEHYSLDKGVLYRLYGDPWPTFDEDEVDAIEKKIMSPPPSLELFLNKPGICSNELILEEAVKCRQAWLLYSNYLDSGENYNQSKQANKERCNFDDFIEKLLETMYCSASTDEKFSDDSQTEDGAPPQKKHC